MRITFGVLEGRGLKEMASVGLVADMRARGRYADKDEVIGAVPRGGSGRVGRTCRTRICCNWSTIESIKGLLAGEVERHW